MTVVSIHQPNFMPWIKLLDKVLASDVYIAYDTVQYTKSEYHSRQRVKTHFGQAWLTVPTRSRKGSVQRIDEVEIDNKQPWRQKHLSILKVNYRKAPFFDEVSALVKDVYATRHTHLADLGVDVIAAVRDYLGSGVQVVRASSLPHSGDNTDRLMQLTRSVHGDVHLTSTFGTDRQYIDWSRLLEAGIAVRVQRFEHPVYPQLHGPFVANLSVLDMLFNCGQATARLLEERRSHQDIDHSTPVQTP
jgi:hypothetical protein